MPQFHGLYYEFACQLVSICKHHSPPPADAMCSTPCEAALSGWFLTNALKTTSTERRAYELFTTYFGDARKYGIGASRHFTPRGCNTRFALHRMLSDLVDHGNREAADRARRFLIPRKFTARATEHWLQTGQALRIICLTAQQCPRHPHLDIFTRATVQVCENLFIPIKTIKV